jgi:hypothetical protein
LAAIVRYTVPCEHEVKGISYVVPEPVVVPFTQVDAPVPATVKSLESMPVTDCENIRLNVRDELLVIVVDGEKVVIDGPKEVMATEPDPELVALTPDWFVPLFFE